MSCLLALAAIGLQAATSVPAAQTETSSLSSADSIKQTSSWKTRLLTHAHHVKDLVSNKMIQLKNWTHAHKKPLLAAAIVVAAGLTFYMAHSYCASAEIAKTEQALLDETKKCIYPPASCWTNAAHAYKELDFFNSEYFNFSRKECMYDEWPSHPRCFKKLDDYLATLDNYLAMHNNYLGRLSDLKRYTFLENIRNELSFAFRRFWKSYFIQTGLWYTSKGQS